MKCTCEEYSGDKYYIEPLDEIISSRKPNTISELFELTKGTIWQLNNIQLVHYHGALPGVRIEVMHKNTGEISILPSKKTVYSIFK